MGSLLFKPIDLSLNRQTAVLFREDAFACSFGSKPTRDVFEPEKYLDWLQVKLSKDPRSAVHVWQGERIVGQLELGRLAAGLLLGYVNLYYLIPEVRGTGIARELDDYAVGYFRILGLTGAQLSVSPTNQRAIRYYERSGWKDLGVRTDAPEVNLMEKMF